MPRGRMPLMLAALGLALAWSLGVSAEEPGKSPQEGKSGTVVGTVTAKGPNFIEVKADGEEKGRRYVPRWIGGLPAQGGGLEKGMLATFRTLGVGSRVRVEWKFEERPRAIKVEVLKPAPGGK